MEEIRRLNDTRMERPFDMDGAVIKLNSLPERETLGSTAKCPRWAIAYKYPPETEGDGAAGYRGAGGPHRRADPQGGCWSRCVWRGPPSPTPRCTIRITSRQKDIRIGDTVVVQQGRGDHPGNSWRLVPGKRPAGDCSPIYLPRYAARSAERRWSGTRTVQSCAAPGRSVPHSVCRHTDPLRQPGRHGHRRARRGR